MEELRAERANRQTVIDPRASLALWLRAGRVQRKLSLDDVARVTKIQPRILEKLEAGSADGLPADVFVRGFVRSVARCVGLDEQEALERYGACTGAPSVGEAGARAFVETMRELAPVTARSLDETVVRVPAATPSTPTAVVQAPEVVVELAPVVEAAPVEAAPVKAAPVEAAPVVETTVAVETAAKKKRAPRKKAAAGTTPPRTRKKKAASEMTGSAAAAEATAVTAADSVTGAAAVADSAAAAAADSVTGTAAAADSVSVAVANSVTSAGSVSATDSVAATGSGSGTTTGSATPTGSGTATDSVAATGSVIATADSATDSVIAASATGSESPASASASPSTPTSIDSLPPTPSSSIEVPWRPTMPPIAAAPSVPWRRPAFTTPTYVAPSLVIDDADPESADLEREARDAARSPNRVSFLPPILLDRDDKSGRQGGLTLAVIILLIAATLTLSYLMRRPSLSGDGVTMADAIAHRLA
jgi:cytoskeletal protein RodZ